MIFASRTPVLPYVFKENSWSLENYYVRKYEHLGYSVPLFKQVFSYD